MEFRFDTLRKSIVHFLNIFNNVKVNKYNTTTGDIENTITVPLKLASKQKFYYWLYDRKHAKRYPMMAASAKGIKPSLSDRGKNKKFTFLTDDLTKAIRTPTPYNIDFELIIVTNYIDEANQILEQILPYFTPYVMTTIKLPEINEKFDMKVILNDVSEDKDFEMPEDSYRTLSWTLSFTAHTFLFKPITDPKIIETIFLEYRQLGSSSDDIPLERTKITEEETTIYNYELLHGLQDVEDENT